MQLLRTDADFRAKSKFKPIRKACGSVHIHTSGIHFPQKLIRMLLIFRKDGIGMSRIILINMGNRFLHRGHCLNRNNQIQILFSIIFFRGRAGFGNLQKYRLIAADFHLLFL